MLADDIDIMTIEIYIKGMLQLAAIAVYQCIPMYTPSTLPLQPLYKLLHCICTYNAQMLYLSVRTPCTLVHVQYHEFGTLVLNHAISHSHSLYV